MDSKDTRYNSRRGAAKKHFRNKAPKTQKDIARVAKARNAPSRDQLRDIALSTVDILECGHYENNSGSIVDIKSPLNAAMNGTILYTPDALPAEPPLNAHVYAETKFTVSQESTLSACKRLVKESQSVLALNFASAKNPGGGVMNGAAAQEESIARSSGLLPCIQSEAASDLYEVNNRDSNYCLYSHHMIYSKNVPVFKNDAGDLLDSLYLCSFISAPAPNASATRQPSAKILEVLSERADYILSVAQYHQHDTIVLGMWGCGCFGNNPRSVAQIFKQLLTTKYITAFSHIHFATTGSNEYDTLMEVFDDLTADGLITDE
jgi:uncharacterized protein (TIGR02452 family)